MTLTLYLFGVKVYDFKSFSKSHDTNMNTWKQQQNWKFLFFARSQSTQINVWHNVQLKAKNKINSHQQNQFPPFNDELNQRYCGVRFRKPITSTWCLKSEVTTLYLPVTMMQRLSLTIITTNTKHLRYFIYHDQCMQQLTRQKRNDSVGRLSWFQKTCVWLDSITLARSCLYLQMSSQIGLHCCTLSIHTNTCVPFRGS